MVAAVTRLIVKLWRTTCSAAAKAASVAALSPPRWVKQMLCGQSSQTRGAPGLTASGAEITGAKGS